MKRKSFLIIAIVFLLQNLSPDFARTTAFNEDVLPPDILPVVILTGSDYEMGYQYGRQAGHFMVKTKEAAWAAALEEFSHAEIDRTLKANQHYIKKFTPENIDIMKGMAAGAAAAGYEISYTDVLLLNCTLPKPKTSTFPPGAEKEILPPKGCSVASAWGKTTTDGRLIGMDTLDGGGAMYGVIIIAFPDNGNNYICGAQAGEIGDHFLMNNKGLFIGNSGGGGSPRDIDNNYGLSWSCSLTHLARFAKNATHAKEMLLDWQINIPENFHLVDTRGNAYVVEKTAAIQSVRKPGDFGERDFLYSTNNYLNEKMKPTKEGDFIKNHGGCGAYAAPRNLMLWDMLNNYQGQVNVDFVKMMLRFPGNPPPYPPEFGWDAKVCRPTNSWVSVVLPDDGDKGIVHICTGPAGIVIHSSTASNGEVMQSSYPYINGTHTFFRMNLTTDPKAVVAAAKKNAENDIAAAYAKLMLLKFNDSGYKVLNDLYSLANSEYYQGCSLYNKGLITEKNESLFYFAQAATKLTRAQAHAMQVYDALEPPATSPSDLGLKPFGESWTEWETEVGKTK